MVFSIFENISFNRALLLYLLRLGVILCPLVALLGNAASDIWLVCFVLFFLLYFYQKKQLDWLRTPWLVSAYIFWLWLMVTANFSHWPDNSLHDAMPWIRFPLYAAALALFLSQDKFARQLFVYACGVGVFLMVLILFIERLSDPAALRLYGPWHQHPKPGWYLSSFGLFIAMVSFEVSKAHSLSPYRAMFISVVVLIASFATGEIYSTLFIMLGLSAYFLLSRQILLPLLTGGVLFSLLLGLLFISNDQLFYRFTEQALTRLPWVPTSDYYEAWKGGFFAGIRNFVMGVGADNYDLYCFSLDPVERLSLLKVHGCHPHPHQIYIQIFAETGIVGLFLWGVMMFCILLRLLKHIFQHHDFLRFALPCALLIAVFWPISTYSEAFGQHKNFFMWTLIGIGLSLSSFQNSFAKKASIIMR